MKNSKGFTPILVILIVLALLGGIYYFGISKNKSVQTNSTTMQQVLTSKNGYSLVLQNGWYLIDDANNNNEFMLRNCPKEELCMENVVAARFANTLLDNSKNLPIQEWLNDQDSDFSYYGKKVTVSKSAIVVANKQAVKVSDAKNNQYWVYVPIKDKVLTIFFTIETGDTKYIDEHLEDLDKILSTFKFIQ